MRIQAPVWWLVEYLARGKGSWTLVTVITIIMALSDPFKEFSLSHNLPDHISSHRVEWPVVPQGTMSAHTSDLGLAILCLLVCLCDPPPMMLPVWASMVPAHTPTTPHASNRLVPGVTSSLPQVVPGGSGQPRESDLERTGGLPGAEG